MQRIDYQLNSTKRLLMAAKDWSMTSNQQPALVFNLSALLSNPIPLSLAHAICIFFSCFQFLSIFACVARSLFYYFKSFVVLTCCF